MNLPRILAGLVQAIVEHATNSVQHAAEDLPGTVDFSQANRRLRRAWRQGRGVKTAYHAVEHQRRRLRRRREIRDLVEGTGLSRR